MEDILNTMFSEAFEAVQICQHVCNSCYRNLLSPTTITAILRWGEPCLLRLSLTAAQQQQVAGWR